MNAQMPCTIQDVRETIHGQFGCSISNVEAKISMQNHSSKLFHLSKGCNLVIELT